MARSCEPRRTSAYSEDLRWKMVYQREIRGLTYDSIAQNVGVDVSTVWRTVKLLIPRREHIEILPMQLSLCC